MVWCEGRGHAGGAREGGREEGLPIDQVAFSPVVAYRVSQLSVSGQGDHSVPPASRVTLPTTDMSGRRRDATPDPCVAPRSFFTPAGTAGREG